MEIDDALHKFGLNKNERIVYIQCLRSGSALASTIAKHANIARTSIYDMLERLQQKGLVSYSIENGKKYFLAADVKDLLRILDNKREAIESVANQLQEFQTNQLQSTRIQVYTGKEGLKTVLYDIVRTGKTIYAYGAAGLSEKMLQWDFPKIIKARIKARIKFKVIFDKSRFAAHKKKLPLTEVRFISKAFQDCTFTEIYGDKVAIFLYSEIPSVVLIESRDIAKSYKRYFEILWKNTL
ncbi:hypothetical protein HZA96_01080 [Candidatus Woesearchaeota archaeon]|nr:hypothetical protein [Candidatus Woesearchaeota archaeon]